MADSQVQHESLLLPGYWRIAGLGKLTENPLTARPEDLRIRAYLAPLQGSEEFPPENGRIAGNSLRQMLLPVGELPRLHLNAILHNGRLVTHRNYQLDFEVRLRRRLDCAQLNVRVIQRLEHDERGDLIIPRRKKWANQIDDPELQGLFVAIGSTTDPFATIIPAIEVFRFFYATSDVLTKSLLRDHFLDPDTHLWNAEKTAMTPDGHAVLWLRKWMLDADARFLARFAFDDYALHQAQQIFLYASAVGSKAGERTIHALPPFQDSVEARFLGMRIGGPDGNRLLVTRMLQCNWKPPWTHLKWDRDNDGRYDPDHRDEREPADWKPGLLTVPDGQNPAPAKLANTPPSTANVPSRLREPEIADRFPELANTPAEKLPQEGTKTRAERKSWKPVIAEAYTGSVVDGRPSKDLVGKTIIEGLEKKPEPTKKRTEAVDASADRADYLTVLRLLQTINALSLAHVEFMTVLPTTATAFEVEFNVFPNELDGKQKAWLYVDEEKAKQRMALLVEVTCNERVRYVIELQQRHFSECSTLVAWQSREIRLPSGVLAVLLMDCARAESATLGSAHLLQVFWARLHHTIKDTDEPSARHFLQRVLDAKPRQETIFDSLD